MKTYAFRFTVRRAEFDGQMVSIVFGGPNTVYADEKKECTFPDAQTYLLELSARTRGPHAASLSLASYRDRKPPGFNKMRPYIYKETA